MNTSLRTSSIENLQNSQYLLSDTLRLNTANDISKMHPALCSRLMPICFDMTPTQIANELEKYKIRIISLLKKQSPDTDEKRISRLIDMNYPDYRTIANKIEFEML